VLGVAGTKSVESSAELKARFVRDAVPLLDELRGSAVRMTSSRIDADDLLQETALRAYASFRSFQPETHVKAWMFRIMTNTWIDIHRRAQRRPAERLTGEFGDPEVHASGRHTAVGLRSAEAEALEHMPDCEIASALSALTRQTQLILHYTYVEGLRTREIAQVMGTPVATVTSRLRRARLELRTLLAEVAHDRGFTRSPTDGSADDATRN
jgi:RNA polymerase sigma-70 factor (ECF subfamily)